MKMNKAVAAVAAGMIAFGAMFSASAAGIGYVNSNALLQAHPKMQKAQLDMRTAAQKAGINRASGRYLQQGVRLWADHGQKVRASSGTGRMEQKAGQAAGSAYSRAYRR